MLASIFLPVRRVYLVFHVSLVQYCAYAYRVMKVQKLVPEGSCTYSTGSLKMRQGGPHLQSNLTTKVKYSTTSNQILQMPTDTARQFAERGDSRGLHPVSVKCLCFWHGLFADLALHQCNVMIALARKEGLIYMWGSSTGTQELAFDQGANKPAEKHCNYNLQSCSV